ncbi:MAG TPA: hypothetical protein VMU83_06225 [Hanamia sp.]|nr:hypothetical protein [Hanamia sp.]
MLKNTQKKKKIGVFAAMWAKQVNDYTWYVTSLGDGSVLKVTYE